jgi:trehalose 6-phosphate phosphatase
MNFSVVRDSIPVEVTQTTRSRLFSLSMSQTDSRVPHLFARWNQISRRIRAANDIRLFLDFDGTLAPICPAPEDVKLSKSSRLALERLSRHSSVHLAIVSGRRSAVLRKQVRLSRVQLLGLYGWERNGRLVLPRETRETLRCLRPVLRMLTVECPGVRVERKGVSFAVHFRGAPPEAERCAQIRIRRLLTRIRANFRLIRSSSAWEIVPRQVQGKGAAIRQFIGRLRVPFLPIYVGDDLTDEPAFSAVRRGITVRVGPATRTNAHFRLRDPEEVRVFLERLEEELS